MKQQLTGVPETLLVALWARAAETRSGYPLIKDEKAVEMVAEIGYDFSRFGKKSKLTQLGVAVRTMILDKAVSIYLRTFPDAVIVNLGAGLDTRHHRLSCDDNDWYEIDLPESICLRKAFFKETDRYRFIEQSMFNPEWIDKIQIGERPVLFIAEGLFMYFTPSKLRPLFTAICDRFPQGQMLFEMVAPLMVGKSKQHETLKRMDSKAEFKWGPKDPKEIESWHPGLHLLNAWNYADHFKRRWGLYGLIARSPFVRPNLACRIVHFRLGPKISAG